MNVYKENNLNPKECVIKAIVFDLGNVLVRVADKRSLERLVILTRLPPDEIVRRIDESSIAFDYEIGKIDSVEYIKKIAEILGVGSYTEKMKEIFLDVIDRPILERDFLLQLKEKYALYMLSNTNPLHFGKVSLTNPDLLSLFKKIFLSYELKMMKPDRNIFKRLLFEIRCKPEEVIFIDDNYENVEAARNLDIRGIIFRDENNLRQTLHQMDVI